MLMIQTILVIVGICLFNVSAESKPTQKLFQKMDIDSSKSHEYYKHMREHYIIHDQKARIGNYLSFKSDDIKNRILQIDSSRMYRKGSLKKISPIVESLQDSVFTLSFFNKDTIKLVIDTTFKTELGLSVWAHTLGFDYINVTFGISTEGSIYGSILQYKEVKTLLIHTVEKGILIGIEQDATDTTVHED